MKDQEQAVFSKSDHTDITYISISIVIPTYDRAALLARSLESACRLTIPPGVVAELIVIDNNCSDDTASVVEGAKERSPFQLRRIVEKQQGLCHSRNRGLKESRYEHVVFFDDDVQISSGWIAGYADAIKEFEADCVVGPVFPVFERGIPGHFTTRVIDSIASSYSRKGNKPMMLPRETGHEIPGCNFGVRKSVALSVGGFDPGLDRKGKELYAGGDFEFGQRLVMSGRRIAYQPRCAIKHMITAEKMLESSLEKRWYGLGVTQAMVEEKSGASIPYRRKMWYLLKSIGFAFSYICFLPLSGRAWPFRLECLRAWGYARTSLAPKTGW